MRGFGQIFAKHGIKINRHARRPDDAGDATGADENITQLAYDTHVTRPPEREKYLPRPEVRTYEPNRPPPLPQAPTPATRRTAAVDSIPDSWQVRTRVPPPPEEKQGEPAATPGPKRKPAHKRRGICLNMSVSEEEAHLLKAYAASKGMGFSEWAREVMFTAMKRKPPKRE